MARDIREILIDILWIVFITIILYVIYQVSRAILGGTWETENIIIAGMGIILGALFVVIGILVSQGAAIGRLDERTKNLSDSFGRLANDFRDHVKH